MSTFKLSLLPMFGITFLACALTSAAAPETPAAPAPADGSLRIGAWNIENLGFKARRGQAPDPADQQKPENLADYILTSKVDVLALEEIHDDDQKTEEHPGEAPWKNPMLDATLGLLEKSTGDAWQYELTEPSKANQRGQTTGVLWRKSKVTLVRRIEIPVKGGEFNNDPELTFWTRRPEAFVFSTGEGKTDFAMVPLHMKSNSGDAKIGATMRTEEAKQLLAALKDAEPLFKGEKDVILLGDANIKTGEREVQEIWSDFTDLNDKEQATWMNPYWKEGGTAPNNFPPAPFDRIFIPKSQPEFANSKQSVHGPYAPEGMNKFLWTKQHRDLRSDHLLVWCDVKISKDDD